MHVGFVMLLRHGAAFCTMPCWWANGWCFAPGGPGSTGSGFTVILDEIPWDATAHIMPYLQYLHTFLLKVHADMPPVNRPAQLAAPVEVRIDHNLVKANQDRHETWHNKPRPKVQRPRTKVQGPRLPMGGGRVS